MADETYTVTIQYTDDAVGYIIIDAEGKFEWTGTVRTSGASETTDLITAINAMKQWLQNNGGKEVRVKED